MTYKTHHEIAGMNDLEEIFTKAYSATDLITFFAQFKAGALTDPEILKVATNNRILNHPGKMLKRHNAAALQEIFEDKELSLFFYKQQSEICQSVLHILVWYGNMKLYQLEKILGRTISKANTTRMATWEPFLLKQGMELLMLENQHNYSYANRDDNKKKFVLVYLPPQIIQILREILPKPAEYCLVPLKRKPKTVFNHCSEKTALTEISRIIQFLKQGHLPLKKTGQATVKGLRELTKIAELAEFYPNIDTTKLQHIKSSMLATFLLSLNLKATDLAAKPQDILRETFREWLKDDNFTFTEQFLKHIKISRTRYRYYYDEKTVNIKKNLFLILKEMPKNGWTSLPDILNFMAVRKINLLEFDNNILDYRHYEESKYGNWEEWYGIGEANINQVLYLPLLKSFFFLTAALGLVEIGYDIPKNPDFSRKNCDYLSEYDGLQLVRLTKLGAYVAGKTKKYTSHIQESTRCQLHLDKTRLLLTMEGSDPITTLNLQKVMEPAGNGRYMLTYASLLKNCHSKQDVDKKIALFKETISQTTPKIWGAFFKTAKKRVDPLTADPGFRIFKIAQNQELLHILTSDPAISELILKVEGLRIAVELPKLSKLTRLLKAHGYLVSQSSLLLSE